MYAAHLFESFGRSKSCSFLNCFINIVSCSRPESICLRLLIQAFWQDVFRALMNDGRAIAISNMIMPRIIMVVFFLKSHEVISKFLSAVKLV